jgi:hypothetical protein
MRNWSGSRRSVCLVWLNALGILPVACGDSPRAAAHADGAATEAGGDALLEAGQASCATQDADGAAILSTGDTPFGLTVAPTTPVPMDDVTVFGFSQVGTHGSDPQVLALAPDMSIRSWTHWDREGIAAADYNVAYLESCHAAGVRFIGGQTTVTFADEWDTTADFEAVATRDAAGGLVNHDDIVPQLHFGSWSSPAFRDYVLRTSKLQIDAGADGIFFDVVEADFYGAGFNGDEGFDDGHLADFNAYLLAKYAGAGDVAARFQMTADNRLRADVPAGDLSCNFNYRRYLARNGWTSNPFAPENPLAAEWAPSNGNRVAGAALGFEQAVTYRHFHEIIDDLRAYARQQYGREIYITANGIFPYVDFQSVGLYGYNQDSPGNTNVDYVPVVNGHLAGDQSLQPAFRRLRSESAAVAPGAPVVLFIDWPTVPMTNYLNLPSSERQDYWRIFAAEAYANGLFFAFHLSDTIGDPTADALGLIPLFQSLAAYYRAHGALYHHVTPSSDTAVTSLSSAMTAVADQTTPDRRLVHVVNHQYAGAIVPQSNVIVTVPSARTPVAVALASPDQSADTLSVPFGYAGGQLTVTIPTLIAYDVVIVSY